MRYKNQSKDPPLLVEPLPGWLNEDHLHSCDIYGLRDIYREITFLCCFRDFHMQSIYRSLFTCTTPVNTRRIDVAFPPTGLGSLTRRNMVPSATSWGKLWTFNCLHSLSSDSGCLHNNNLWQKKQWYLSFDSDLVEMRWSSSMTTTQWAQAQAASCSSSSRESGIIWAQGQNLLTFATAAWWQSGFTSQVYVRAAAAANGVNTARKRLRECNF